MLFRRRFDDDRRVRCLGLRGVLVPEGKQFFAATAFYRGEGGHGETRVRRICSHNSTLVRFRVLYKWLKPLF